jgi:sugar O-acyltransferase (sialic acid O-acetyltransferase NeuD family)
MNQISQEFPSFVILGGGQHAYLIKSLATKQGLKILGWIDRSSQTQFKESKDFLHFVKDEDYANLSTQGVGLIPGIASLKLWKKRSILLSSLADPSLTSPNVIDVRAMISEDVELGTGNQILGNCFIQSFTQIGSWSIINSGATIEHDSIIGDFVHVAPGATICGGVNLGSGSYIGAGTTIIEGITIGENAVIGAGSLVLKDVAAGEIQYGAPSSNKGSNYDRLA